MHVTFTRGLGNCILGLWLKLLQFLLLSLLPLTILVRLLLSSLFENLGENQSLLLANGVLHFLLLLADGWGKRISGL